ncbi:MAG: SRPBCC domain-containing protein [Acidobacteria bacterium]|nr:SRPBCC domain-containing protein [Acidobacteriota bacterium]
MSKDQTSTLQHTIWLKAPSMKVWNAVTRGKDLGRWFTVPERLELKRGGRWDFVGFPGKALEVRKVKKFVHTHTFVPGSVSRMTYELRPNGNYSQLVVLHGRFGKDRKTRACWQGAWPFILSNLKTYLETGSPMWETCFKGKAD